MWCDNTLGFLIKLQKPIHIPVLISVQLKPIQISEVYGKSKVLVRLKNLWKFLENYKFSSCVRYERVEGLKSNTTVLLHMEIVYFICASKNGKLSKINLSNFTSDF